MDQNTRQIHKGGPPRMCGQHNVRATAGDNRGQNTARRHTPRRRIEFEIPDLAGNRTRADVLEVKNSTDCTTATDISVPYNSELPRA